jgi:hypothetical protein
MQTAPLTVAERISDGRFTVPMDDGQPSVSVERVTKAWSMAAALHQHLRTSSPECQRSPSPSLSPSPSPNPSTRGSYSYSDSDSDSGIRLVSLLPYTSYKLFVTWVKYSIESSYSSSSSSFSIHLNLYPYPCPEPDPFVYSNKYPSLKRWIGHPGHLPRAPRVLRARWWGGG